MIDFINVTKSFPLRDGRRRYVLRNANLSLPPGEIVGFLGRNGAGKSTTLRIIAGTQGHDSGTIIRKGSISWPIGFALFLVALPPATTDALLEFVREFAELGHYFDEPFRTYSSGMRARLAFGVSMGIPFDTYLVDEVTTVGDANFRQKCNDVFTQRLADSGAIIVSHSMPMVADICTRIVVLEGGQATLYEDVQAGIEHHQENMKKAAA